MALTPSQEIDKFISDLTDWRGKWIKKFRALILKTAPEVTEDWKWGVPVWTYKGNMIASGVFKDLCWLLGSSVKFFGILRRNFRQVFLLFLPGWVRLFFECTPKSFG